MARRRQNLIFEAARPGLWPSPAEWKAIQKAYGRKLCNDAALSIGFVTATYSTYAAAIVSNGVEHTPVDGPSHGEIVRAIRQIDSKNAAPGHNNFRKKLRRLRAASIAVGIDIDSDLFETASRQKVDLYDLRAAIRRLPTYGKPGEWALYLGLLQVVVAFTEFLEDTVAANEGVLTYDPAWCSWVQALTTIARHYQLPAQVQKDPRNSPSPFVKLVFALQEIMPPELQRHHTQEAVYTGALAQAIWRARRQAIPSKLDVQDLPNKFADTFFETRYPRGSPEAD
jgi:hypothetical protein